MDSTTSAEVLPSGRRVFTTFPDSLFIPEFFYGGSVWILVASNQLADDANPMGWVMFVSLFCFIGTTLWFFIFISGRNQSSGWPGLDAGFHFLAVVLYLSASVILANVTDFIRGLLEITDIKVYNMYIAASVMSFIATLHYFLHAICSAFRWRRS